MMKVVVFFCFLWLCMLFVGNCQEKTVHTLKEHLFSVFPISNQPGRCLVQHPGTLTLHHWFQSFTDVPAVVPSAGLNYFCCDTCSSLRWQVSFNFQVIIEFWLFFQHTQFCKNQMVSLCYLFLLPYPTVCECSMLQCVLNWQNHPWSGLFLHEWESGGGEREVVHCPALVGCCWMLASWQIPIIYLFSFVYYIQSDLSIISICSSNVKWLLFHENPLFSRIYQIVKCFV
jgi:hypothetical protein